MKQLQNVFNYEEQKLRTVTKDGEPWFVAKDVCEILEISNPTRALNRLDADEGALIEVSHPQSPEKNIQVNAVNEYGLYNLVLSSRKPEAKQFKRWITHEVIPSIRQQGSYQIKPLSEREQLMASMKLTLETAEEISTVKNEVKEIRTMVQEQITIDYGEQRMFQKKVAKKVYSLADGREKRDKLFRELHREIKDRFGVASYKDIKRKDLDSALNYIEAWIPRKVS